MSHSQSHLALAWVSFCTIVRKELIRFVRIWSQTLVPPVITSTLYFVIFGGFVGSQIAHIRGFTYMAFITPGLVMMAIINSSYANVSFSFFSNKFQKSIEELLVSPTPDYVIILGYTFGGVLRGFAVGFLTLLVSLFFTDVTIHHAGYLFGFSILTATLFSLAGLTNGILAKKFDDVSIIPTFILTPLTYLGGIFYSIEQLPPFWRALTQLNPIVYMINGFRYGALGISDIDIATSFVSLCAICIGLFWLNLYFFRKGIGLKA